MEITKTEEFKFCLRWDNFKNSLSSTLVDLYTVNELVDVTIATEDQQFEAHKVVLAASSTYFRNIFLKNSCQHPVIILKDASAEQVRHILSFIYEGQVCIPQSCFQEFASLAAALKIRGLEEAACNTSFNKVASVVQKMSERNSNCSLKDAHDYRTAEKILNHDIPNNSPARIMKKMNFLNEPPCKRARVCSPASSPSVQNVTSPAPASSPPPSDEVFPHDPGELKTDIQDMLEVKLEPCDGSVQTSYQPEPTKEKTQSSQEDQSAFSDSEPNELQIVLKPNNVSQDSSPSTTADTSYILPKSLASGGSMPLFDQIAAKQPKETQRTKFRPEFPSDGSCLNMPFPCPFCDKAYTSWGFRRRHIKGCHTSKPELPCKWCSVVLPSQDEWQDHVQRIHNLSCIDAHSGLMILDEAHMVLQSAAPTRIASLMEGKASTSSPPVITRSQKESEDKDNVNISWQC